MAMRDDLTQLFNRRYFFERLERELQTAKGFGRPLGVAIIDLDSMKHVNNTHGHAAGDRLLAAFGKFLLQQTRASDVPARTGGDEFAIILPDTERNEADVMIERLEAALDKSDLMDGEASSVKIAASVGLAGFSWDAATTDELVRQADASMYAKKHENQLTGAKEDEIPTIAVAPAQSGNGAEIASGN
jgi:diguanylate cyclase (GGDEF)-like protein